VDISSTAGTFRVVPAQLGNSGAHVQQQWLNCLSQLLIFIHPRQIAQSEEMEYLFEFFNAFCLLAMFVLNGRFRLRSRNIEKNSIAPEKNPGRLQL